MIQLGSYLQVADNSGAKRLKVIQVMGRRKGGFGKLGDVVVASVKVAAPRTATHKKEVVKAVIVRQKKHYQRPDGSSIKFDDNAAVLINPDLQPRGTRILGPVARELREKGYAKIISLASEVV